MTLKTAVDAEHESKSKRLVVRWGAEADQLVTAGARGRGISVSHYVRMAAVNQALADAVRVADEH